MHKNTYFETTEDALKNRKWQVLDADGQTLGRIASTIAALLRGKNNPRFTPHADTGDFVVVINAEKVKFTGNKRAAKIYYTHSGYTGGVKDETADELLERKPEEVIRRAVKGMLPATVIGRNQLKKLKIYVGEKHPHQAQQPVAN